MQVIEVDINKLKPSEYNPRAMSDKEAADLAASVKQFGMVEPIIVNQNKARHNIIIGGHQRYFILKKQGAKTVPVVYVDIADLNKEQELNIRLNKNLGHWDFDLLANFDESILLNSGFDKLDLENIFERIPTDGDWVDNMEQKGKDTGYRQITFVYPIADMEFLKSALNKTGQNNKERALMVVLKKYDDSTAVNQKSG